MARNDKSSSADSVTRGFELVGVGVGSTVNGGVFAVFIKHLPLLSVFHVDFAKKSLKTIQKTGDTLWEWQLHRQDI